MRKHLLPLIIIAITSILISLPLAKPGLHIIHDDQQVARLFLFDQALRSGQFPVRWVDELGFGFGYPLFVFYPPLVYVLGDVFHLAGFGFIDSVKLVFFSSILFSGLAMYVFINGLWGRLPAQVASLFYMLVPYRAIDVYIRGALAESFSFVWLPLILWSFYKLSTSHKSIYIYLSAIFLAFLMLTHNLIFLPFMLILPFFLLFLVWKSPDKKLSIVKCFMSIVSALALSAFFWLPALLEKKFTIVDDLLLTSLANYKIHFVYPQQLWNWPWGFGGSAAGLSDGLSFKIGKLHILISIAAFIVTFFHILKNKASRQLLALRSFSEVGSIAFLALFLSSAFMTTFYSKPIWDLITPLGYLQFPWRFLIFTALFTSILAGSFIFLIRVPILKLVASFLLIFLLMIPNFKLFKPQSLRPDLTDALATSSEVINWDVSSSSFEYLPKGVPLYRGKLDTNLVAIEKDDIPKRRLEITEGDADINILEEKPHRFSYNINSRKPTQVKANVFNFPGWEVSIDGEKVDIDDKNRLKLIILNIPTGDHQVKIEFKNTPIRTIANLITLATIIVMTMIVLRTRWRS